MKGTLTISYKWENEEKNKPIPKHHHPLLIDETIRTAFKARNEGCFSEELEVNVSDYANNKTIRYRGWCTCTRKQNK